MWVFADRMFSKILLRRNISTQTMSVYLYDYCGSIISKVKENSRDISGMGPSHFLRKLLKID